MVKTLYLISTENEFNVKSKAPEVAELFYERETEEGYDIVFPSGERVMLPKRQDRFLIFKSKKSVEEYFDIKIEHYRCLGMLWRQANEPKNIN